MIVASTLCGRYDVAVVGAGPAGLAAAALCARAGLTCILFDDQPKPGGQIYRGVTNSPLDRGTVFGGDYWRGESLVRAALASGAHYVSSASVWGLLRENEIAVSSAVARGRFAPRASSWRPARSSGHFRSKAGRFPA